MTSARVRRVLAMLVGSGLVTTAPLGCGRGDADNRPGVAEVGREAPPYAATTLAGRPDSLGALRGKVVLMNVWATWCAPCRDEIPYLQQLYTTHAPQGLEVIGVSVDARGEEQSIDDFRREFGMTYPVWLDPDERVQALYRALGVPASYLVDRDGILRWKHLGIVKATDRAFTSALATALGTAAQ